jgi:thiol-disulfide isomerase/thioredoxin
MQRLSKLIILLLSAAMMGACALEAPEGRLTVGTIAPTVKTKSLEDVGGDMSRLTTYRYPDERMYQYSIDEALQMGKPVLVEFATPGHCTVCDKQLQMLKALIAKYGSDIIFLHMDQYKNPEAFTAFKVKGDPWTFVIDDRNVVRFKQSGRMLYNELDYIIASVVNKENKENKEG